MVVVQLSIHQPRSPHQQQQQQHESDDDEQLTEATTHTQHTAG